VNPAHFRADLEEKPTRLRELSAALPDLDVPRAAESGTTYLVGMGSSHYAGQVVAGRLRREGRSAHAEIASSDLLPPLREDDVVLAVSASGGSVETLDAVRRLRATAPAGTRFVSVTNRDGSELAGLCDADLPLLAGPENGGVACRTFQHTLALLLSATAGFDPEAILRAAEATADLLERRDEWLPRTSELLLGPDGSWIAAPARRLSSALQSALMLREGPRRAAVGCETGDWSHVDVYLTKTLDYRLLLLGGSAWEPQLLDWIEQRGSTVVGVGPTAPSPAVAAHVRYRHDEDDDVRLLTETLVAELVAAEAWAAVESSAAPA
jgi:D-arabinose 5-phosphate isomerase GutQ